MTSKALAQRQLGSTAVKTSALGLGGAPVGGFRFMLSEDQGAATISAGYEAGLTYFDTSPYYGYGRIDAALSFFARSAESDRTSGSASVKDLANPGTALAPAGPA